MSGHPLTQPATSSRMRFFTSKSSFPIPHPPQMSNKGNYILSLSQFTTWLGGVADEMGVEVYPGFAGAGLVYGDQGEVRGVITNEVGLDRQGRMKDNFEPGMRFLAKVTLLAEGAHGSLSKTVINRFDLRRNADPQTYGMGIKEVWRVDEGQYRPGEVVHTMGWPLDWKTYGGGWVYHMADGLVSLGLVVGLDYANPYLSPYRELQVHLFCLLIMPGLQFFFQRMKHHPYFSKLLANGERLAYGGRTLNEGGLQSIPQLHFPGGALIGCSAGFVNVPKIKGTHNAMKSGMVAAEAAFLAVEGLSDMSVYEETLKRSWVWNELREVRNIRPSFNTPLGIWGGIAYSGLDSLILKGRVPWTFRTKTSDASHTKRARYVKLHFLQKSQLIRDISECTPIVYPPPQPPLSTDLLTSLTLTATNHAEDQPVHLRLPLGTDAHRAHVQRSVGEYAGLLGRACPAAVYEYVDASEKDIEGAWEGKKLVINSQVRVVRLDIIWFVTCQHRIVFIASYVISKCLRKTSHGPCPRVVVVRNTVCTL